MTIKKSVAKCGLCCPFYFACSFFYYYGNCCVQTFIVKKIKPDVVGRITSRSLFYSCEAVSWAELYCGALGFFVSSFWRSFSFYILFWDILSLHVFSNSFTLDCLFFAWPKLLAFRIKGVGGSNICVVKRFCNQNWSQMYTPLWIKVGRDNFFGHICFYLYFTARKSILSQLFRQSTGYI